MKVIVRILLAIAIVFMATLCVLSVVIPINFEATKTKREADVVKNLIALRTAEVEFRSQKGYFTADLDSLVLFLQTAPKKDVLKEGALTDAQLEEGMTEKKAIRIIEAAKKRAQRKLKTNDSDSLYAYIWEKDRKVKQNGLQGFRRDTVYTNMIQSLYKGQYTEETIHQITLIPFTDNQKFEVQVNNDYTDKNGIKVPLFQISAHYDTYLGDQNEQERVNLIDKENKLERFPGLKVGSIDAPNNNAGNWE